MSMKEVAEQLSTLRVLAFVVVGVLTFLSVPDVSLSAALAQQQTTDNTAGDIPKPAELPQQLLMMAIVNDEPLYRSISSDRTSLRVVDVVSPSVVIEEVSYIEKAFMKNIGNVTNTATFFDTISGNGTIIVVHGVGKGIITTENGDTVSWNAYGLGLPAGYGDGNNNDTATNTTAADNSLNNTEKITIYRGIIFFSTDSERLSFMNNLVGLYISQVNDENGTSLRQIWEWRNNY